MDKLGLKICGIVFMFLIGTFIVLITFQESPLPSKNWYHEDWTKARSIDVASPYFDSKPHNYPVLVHFKNINSETLTQTLCNDIVLTDARNTTKLDHELVVCDIKNDVIEVFVFVPVEPYSEVTRFMVYYDKVGT